MKQTRPPLDPSADTSATYEPLNESEGNTFLDYYNKLPEKSPSLIRLFFRKDSYVAYGQDAEFIADEFYYSRKVLKDLEVKKGGRVTSHTSLKFLNLPQTLAETVVRTLVKDKELSIEVHALGDDKRWFLFRKGSPGNVSQIEDLVYGNRSDVTESVIMMAVSWSMEHQSAAGAGGKLVAPVAGKQPPAQRIVGVAFADAMLKKIYVSEFVDTDNFVNLESLIVQVSAKECFVQHVADVEKDAEASKVREVLERCQVLRTERKKADFGTENLEQDLKTLLGTHHVESHAEREWKQAMSALAALIRGLELLSVDANLGFFKLQRYDLSQYMRLDAAASFALNLVPNAREGNQQYNLYALLNRCKTPMGQRKLLQFIKQPLVSIEAISRRHDIVEVFTEDTALLAEIRGAGLRSVSDVERIAKKIQRGKGGLKECVMLYLFVESLNTLARMMKKYCGDVHKGKLETEYIAKLEEQAPHLMRFSSLVEQVVDLAAINEHIYQVNPDFDDAFKKLYTERKEVQTNMLKRSNAIEAKLFGGAAKKGKSASTFKLDRDPIHGWVYRVSTKDSKVLDSAENKKLFHQVGQTIKNVHKFRDDQLERDNDAFQTLLEQYNENCKDVIKRVMETVQGFLPRFEIAQEIVAELDVLTAFADAGKSALKPYVRPIMHEMDSGSSTILLNSRHPILESYADISFVPNHCRMVRNESHFNIITGPNMGGKSTYIRQVGLIVLMAQIGCFIPCDKGSEVTIVDAILARVGAGDSQLRGVSTFMAEMLETATILKTATRHSLVIIDELGRGTSTYDGFGLAWAISECLAQQIGCFSLFATHFHELTQLSEEMPGVKNLHVSATVTPNEGLLLEYKIKDGASDQSFGIHVAKLARFPDSVIQIATQKAQELESFDNDTKNLVGLQGGDNAMDVDNGPADDFICSILTQFSDLPLDTMTPDQIREALNDIKKLVEASDLPLVQQLLASQLS